MFKKTPFFCRGPNSCIVQRDLGRRLQSSTRGPHLCSGGPPGYAQLVLKGNRTRSTRRVESANADDFGTAATPESRCRDGGVA